MTPTRSARSHILVEAGKSLSSERSLDGVLHRLLELAVELTNAKYGALGVLDETGTTLETFITTGLSKEAAEKIGALPIGRGILKALIDDPRPLRLENIADDPRSVGFPSNHPPMTTFLGVPIITDTPLAGRIYLTEKEGDAPFSEEDEQLVVTLASQAAVAIDNARLNEQLQETAAQLKEANLHKSTFLANMSHELRSPLNTIIGYTRLLRDEARNLDEEQLEDLRIVLESSEHLLALITELLDLQRIEAGRVELVCEYLDLCELIESVTASMQPLIPPKVELHTNCESISNSEIYADRTRLRQILLNVLGNAAKFTSFGSIKIKALDASDIDFVTVEISDTGRGIPPQDQARIFDMFFQSKAAQERTPHPNEGAGLGLALTKLLVELHGGTVSLRSAIGVGTTVTIKLPRRRSE